MHQHLGFLRQLCRTRSAVLFASECCHRLYPDVNQEQTESIDPVLTVVVFLVLTIALATNPAFHDAIKDQNRSDC